MQNNTQFLRRNGVRKLILELLQNNTQYSPWRRSISTWILRLSGAENVNVYSACWQTCGPLGILHVLLVVLVDMWSMIMIYFKILYC